MKLVYIYGPPAVGKFQVSKQLAKMINFKLFHNHLTADYVSNLFSKKNKISNELKKEIALKMFEEAAKNDINLIFTMVHEPRYNNFVKKIVSIIEKHKGEVLFVRLFCKEKTLYERVTNASRKEFDKVKTVKELKLILKKGSKLESVPFKGSLTMNNDSLSPKKCAEKIKKYYKL